MRIAFGWIVGILTAAIIIILGSEILHLIRIPTYIHFGETIMVTRGGGRYSYDEEIDGTSTAIGFAIGIMGFIFGAYTGTKAAGETFSRSSILFGKAALGALAIYGAGGAILFKIFGTSGGFQGIIHNLMQLGVAAVAFFIMRDWYNKRIAGTKSVES